MVGWQCVMWRRLTLTLLLASIASSGNSSNKNKSNRSNNGTTCPESCRCSRIQPIEILNNNNNINRKKSTEVHCKGKIPSIEFMPNDSRRLIVEGTKPQDIINMLLKMESQTSDNGTSGDSERRSDTMEMHQSDDSNSPDLRELVFINCSLKHLNISFKTVSKSVFGKSLNLSSNEFTDTEALSIKESDSLDRLDLSYNQLSKVRNEAFAKFSRLSLLNLRKNRIEVVEERGFIGLGNLESLDLSDNHLATLDNGAFVPLCLLQKLDLSGNKLVGVLRGGHQWFDALGRLKELDVSRNGKSINIYISSSSSSSSSNKNISKNSNSSESQEEMKEDEKKGGKNLVALEALPIGLKVLRLAENPLTDIELSLVLGSGRRLETLDASRIGLDRVPSALTRSVRSLILSGNRITSIRSGDFDSYPLLRLVDLSNNIVNNVEDDAFGRLENLEKLDLSNNRLIEIPQSLPSSLLHLLLSHNSIVKLTPKDLQGVCKLKKLVVNDNLIREIEVGSMSQLGFLAELDISNNPIKQLPANTFGGPRSLVSVFMSGLTSLEWDREKRADMAFPIPAPEGLVTLDLSRSPALAAQLLADEAALSACKSLRRLNLAQTNLTTLRSDLAYLLPQLHTLGLSDNLWNCTRANSEEILWLAEWIKQHEEIQPPGKCATETFQETSTFTSNDTIFLNQLTSYSLGLDNASTTNEPIPRSSSSSALSLESQYSIINGLSKEESRNTTEQGNLIFEENNGNNYQERLQTLMPNSLTYNESNIIDIAANNSTSESTVFGIDNVTKLENSAAANNYSIFVPVTKNPIAKSDNSVKDSINSTALQRDEFANKNDYSLNTNEDIELKSEETMLERSIELMNGTVAEELIGRDESAKSSSRTSEVTSTTAIGAHPGMLVIVGAILSAIIALSVVLSRRVTLATRSKMQSVVLFNRESYQRQENIEVHSLQQQQQQQQPPIITDLW